MNEDRGLLGKMLAALAGSFYAMAVQDDGCRWENDVLCGGTRKSPLQPAEGGAPPPAKTQQQQEKTNPYDLEMQNEKDNEVKPQIFDVGAKHSHDDGHDHTPPSSKKSTDHSTLKHTLDDGHDHAPRSHLKSKDNGCRWENDVLCGGTEAAPPKGGAGAPPAKTQQQQDQPTPYELEMQNGKDTDIEPQIFGEEGASTTPAASSEASTKHSLDDGHEHMPPFSKKLNNKKHSLNDGHDHTPPGVRGLDRELDHATSSQ